VEGKPLLRAVWVSEHEIEAAVKTAVEAMKTVPPKAE
jgi:hypothetical protein